MHAARIGRRAGRVRGSLLVREDGDQAAVARVEVEVALRLVVEVRLLEHERHPEHALPEADRRLPVGADDRDVVDTLALDLAHSCGGKDYPTGGASVSGRERVAVLTLTCQACSMLVRWSDWTTLSAWRRSDAHACGRGGHGGACHPDRRRRSGGCRAAGLDPGR